MKSNLTIATFIFTGFLIAGTPTNALASGNPLLDSMSAGASPVVAIEETYRELLPLGLEEALSLALATRISVKDVLTAALKLSVDTVSGLTSCFIAAENRSVPFDAVTSAAQAIGIPGDVIAQALLQANGATASGQPPANARAAHSGSEQIGYVYVAEDAPQAVSEPPDIIPPPPASEGDGRISPDSPTNLTSNGLI